MRLWIRSRSLRAVGDYVEGRDGAAATLIRAAFSVPVLDGDKAIASLACHFTASHTPSMLDIERNEVFARLIAISVKGRTPVSLAKPIFASPQHEATNQRHSMLARARNNTAATIHTVTTRVPDAVAANCRKSPDRMAWLERLPAVVQELEHRWKLTPDTPLGGEEPSCSYVQAVRRPDGTPAVLKISMPHMEQEHEPDGLRFWNGDPTVRLLESDDELHAILLERCQPGTTLRVLDESEQDIVISGLLRRLWRPLPRLHEFRPLSALIEYWSKETLAEAERWPDGGLVREGLRVFKELPRTAVTDVLLATDLHAGNVLRSERQPWLVIDPKPFVGDPAYDGTQHLFNCSARLQSHPETTIKRLADLLSVDYERLKLWTFARAAAEPRDNWSNREWMELAHAIAP